MAFRGFEHAPGPSRPPSSNIVFGVATSSTPSAPLTNPHSPRLHPPLGSSSPKQSPSFTFGIGAVSSPHSASQPPFHSLRPISPFGSSPQWRQRSAFSFDCVGATRPPNSPPFLFRGNSSNDTRATEEEQQAEILDQLVG